MKHLLIASSLFFLVELNAYAGGSIGGVGPSVALEDSLLNAAFSLDSLPKAYADREEFRRTQARLSVTDTQLASMILNGETVQVRKLNRSIVDDNVSKEILPQ